MGYTHYWYFPSEYEVDTKTWNRIVQDFEKLLNVSYYVPKGLKKLLKTKKTGEESHHDQKRKGGVSSYKIETFQHIFGGTDSCSGRRCDWG